VVCAIATLLVWSGFILLARLGVRTTMAPPDLIALRFAIAGSVMLPWLLRRGLGGLSWPRAIVLALLAGPGFAAPAFYGFVHAPAAHGAALMPGTLPLWTVVLAALVVAEKITTTKLVGIILTLAGIAVISFPDFLAPDPRGMSGDLLFPAASLSWASYTVLARRWGVAPLQSAAVVFVLSGLICVPAYLVVWGPRVLSAPPIDLLIQGIYQGLIATLASIMLFMRAVRALGAGPTTLVTAAVPGVVAIVGIPLLGEWPTWLTAAGILLVSAGVVVTVLGAIRAGVVPTRTVQPLRPSR